MLSKFTKLLCIEAADAKIVFFCCCCCIVVQVCCPMALTIRTQR